MPLKSGAVPEINYYVLKGINYYGVQGLNSFDVLGLLLNITHAGSYHFWPNLGLYYSHILFSSAHPRSYLVYTKGKKLSHYTRP